MSTKDEKQEPSAAFEPLEKAKALELVASFAAQFPTRSGRLAPETAVVRAGVELLREAGSWLDMHRTPFGSFQGEAILHAVSNGLPVAADELVSALRGAAVELVQVNKLAQLRPSRRRDP